MEPCRSREELQALTINSLLDGTTQPSSDEDYFFLDNMLSSLTNPPLPSFPPNLQDDPSYSSLSAKLRLHQIASDTSSSFNPLPHLNGIGGSSVDDLYNGFGAGSLHGIGSSPAPFVNQEGPSIGSQAAATAPGQPRQRVRARRGQATDPHSIAERLRRERIAERMKALQELVPNANKTDKASMLDEIIDYVKFLQLQVKVLSMSRLGGAAAVAPLVADISSSEGGGAAVDCCQPDGRDSQTVTEHQVAKMMEEDMGSAMQYLQGKGLCLMPISLATAISTATTCKQQPRPAKSSSSLHFVANGDGPASPGLSALTVQSATTLIGKDGVSGSGSATKS